MSQEVHIQTQNGKATGGRRHWGTTAPVGETCTYRIALPTAGRLRNYPVEGCQGRAAMRMAMRVHLFHWHVRDTIIVL